MKRTFKHLLHSFLLLRQKVFYFFSPQSVHRPYQNSGHTGGSFFFTSIGSPTIPKFRTYRRVFLFHLNQFTDHTKIQDIQEGLSFSPHRFTDHTKIQDVQEGLSFSPQSVHRPYQNSGHTGGSFFFTSIGSPTIPKFRTYRRI